MAPSIGAEVMKLKSDGKRMRRSVNSAMSARIMPRISPPPIAAGTTMIGFGNAGAIGATALSRTAMSANVSLLCSLACAAARSRAFSSSTLNARSL